MTIRIPPYSPSSKMPPLVVEPLMQQKAPELKDAGNTREPQKMENIDMPGIRERVPEPKSSGIVQRVFDFFKRLLSDS
jgi:hypothetical protein